MDVIYLDSLFGLNLLIDYCLVLVSARVCGVVLRRWRYALAALIGALYAALMVLPGFGWLANGMMKLALGAAMALIAFGGEAHLVRCTVVFFAVSAAFGGAVYAASMLAGVSPGSGALVTVSGRVLALASLLFAVGGAILLFQGEAYSGVGLLVMGFLVSPFGIPAFAEAVADFLHGLNSSLMGFIAG